MNQITVPHLQVRKKITAMEIRKFEYFLAVVTEGSFRKAAEKCFVSQTAISQQIAALEQELGFHLFDRTAYRAKLTLSGESFYRSCKKMLDDYRMAVDQAKLLENGYIDEFTIGIAGPMEKKYLPMVLRVFSETYPQTDIIIKEHNFSEFAQCLEDQSVDVVFGLKNDFARMKQIETYDLFKMELHVITALNHPWVERSEVYGNDLKNEKIISFSRKFSETYHKNMVESCQKDGFSPVIVKEVDSLDSMLLMVGINKGIAITSKDVVGDNEHVHLLKLKETHHHSEYCIARDKKNKNPIIDRFIEIAVGCLKR